MDLIYVFTGGGGIDAHQWQGTSLNIASSTPAHLGSSEANSTKLPRTPTALALRRKFFRAYAR